MEKTQFSFFQVSFIEEVGRNDEEALPISVIVDSVVLRALKMLLTWPMDFRNQAIDCLGMGSNMKY